MRKLFFSTTDIQAISHRVIIGASIRFEEARRNDKLQFYPQRREKALGSIFRFVVMLVTAVVTGRLFGTAAVDIRYRTILVGRYAISAALRHPSAYLNKIVYYGRLARNLFYCVRNIDNFLAISNRVAALYVNEPAYINGVYCELAAKLGLPVYHNMYPYRLTRFAMDRKTDAVNAFIVHPLNVPGRTEKGRHFLESIIASTGKISYMANVEFESRAFAPSDADVVIYAHSFTDAQQAYGGDRAFLSMYDWLVFTLDELKDRKVVLKAHPGFFRKGYAAQVIEWDRVVFEAVIKRFSGRPNLTIIDWPMRNNELLSSLDKECLLVSHHGNALLEGAAFGFRCICAQATAWQKYPLFNVWNTRQEYRQLLNSPSLLKLTEAEQLHGYVYDLYEGPCSFFHGDSWRQIAERETGVPANEISKNSKVLGRLSEEEIERLVDAVAKKLGTMEFH